MMHIEAGSQALQAPPVAGSFAIATRHSDLQDNRYARV
jgi:hypothetical protein